MPKTIVLDLDETLLHTFDNPVFIDQYKIYSDPRLFSIIHPPGGKDISYSMNFDGERLWGLLRPNIFTFLKFVIDNYDVIIWSAGTDQYVNEIVKQIFLDSGMKTPKLIWGRSRCEYSDKGKFMHKPIIKLNGFNSIEVDPKSTLIIDDKTYTFTENPNNGVLIPQYCPGGGNVPTLTQLFDRSDDALIKLMEWLQKKEVMDCKDVRDLDKSEIFT